MSIKRHPVLVALSLTLSLPVLALAGVSNQPLNNAELEVRHGFVVAREVLDEKSAVPAGAIIGGLIGLASGSGRSGSSKAKRAVGGAVVGGVIGNQVDRSRRQWVYTIRFPAGDEMQFVLDDDSLRTGDCAAVREGRQSTSVQYSSAYFCNRSESERVVEPNSDSESGELCAESKRQLLAAQTSEETELAERKVRLLCQE